MNDSICAVIVTYNRKDLLIKCLNAILNQSYPVDAIYIVDNNSTDDTLNLLKKENYIDSIPLKDQYIKTIKNNVNINLISLSENIGGAGGFYEAVKKASLDDYDWIWIMDDDALPTRTCLENLVPYTNLKDTVALASLKVDLEENILFNHRGYFNFDKGLPIQKHISLEDTEVPVKDIDMVSFVGLFVNNNAVKKIGYPKKEFFIHADDLEYCIRLRSIGKIKLVNDSIIKHAEGSLEGTFKKKIFNKTVYRRPYDKLWINYYMQRNLIWLGKKYSRNKLSLYSTLIKNYLLTIIGIILFDDNKYRRIKFYTNSYLDGLMENFDNNKPKRILYDDMGG